MKKTVSVGDIVYLMMSPNNQYREYRTIKCEITRITHRKNIHQNINSISDVSIYDKDYTIGLTSLDNTKHYYCNKHLDKIYYEDELDVMNNDIKCLNEILAFKQKQKKELQEFIDSNYSNWNYRSTI